MDATMMNLGSLSAFVFSTTCAVAVFAAEPSADSTVYLVKEGKAAGEIIVPKEASAQLSFAAEKLQFYIKESTGATLPINHEESDRPAIHLGSTSTTSTPDKTATDKAEPIDSYRIKRSNAHTLSISGNSDWGTEFGVYDFLERHLGIRWLASTDLFTDIPKASSVTIPDWDIKEVPAFLSRELYPFNTDKLPAPAKKGPITPWVYYSDNALWGRFNRLRKDLEFHHYLRELFPVSKFGKTNPEFYPFRNGARQLPKDDKDFTWQPNFSAPGIVNAAVEQINEFFDKNPQATSFPLGINDTSNFDQSPESKKRRSGKNNSVGLEDISDDYFMWANDVVAKVLERHPGKHFGMLAYFGLLNPPERVKVHPAIVPFITYEVTRWKEPKSRARMQQLTNEWKAASSTLGWYDYAYGANYLVPRVFPHAEQGALRWARENQVRYYFAEVHPNWGEGPNVWLLSKLLWNPNVDVDALMQEWCVSAVGPAAAPKLKEYYELWEHFWADIIPTSSFYMAERLWLLFSDSTYLLAVPKEYVERATAMMDEVVALADTPIRKERAEKLKTMWDLYSLSITTYQGNRVWESEQPETEAEAVAYAERIVKVIHNAQARLKLLSALRHDPLYGHSIYRITIDWGGSDSLGQHWGSDALWPLVRWIDKAPKVREILEQIASQKSGEPLYRMEASGKDIPIAHSAPQTAAMILEQSEKPGKQLLGNPSFEEGLASWSTTGVELVEDFAREGKSSVKLVDGDKSLLLQRLKYEAGRYYASVQIYAPAGAEGVTARLEVTPVAKTGKRTGPKLPIGEIALKPGQWTSFVMPLTLAKLSTAVANLKFELTLKGATPEAPIMVDGASLIRVTEESWTHVGLGAEGED